MTDMPVDTPLYGELSKDELLTVIHETLIGGSLYDLLYDVVYKSSHEDREHDYPDVVKLQCALEAIPYVLAKGETP